MRRNLLFITLAGSLSIAIGCSSHLKPHEVLVIKKTNTYHREGCPPTKMAKTVVMTAAEAKAENYKPCAGCKPDSE